MSIAEEQRDRVLAAKRRLASGAVPYLEPVDDDMVVKAPAPAPHDEIDALRAEMRREISSLRQQIEGLVSIARTVDPMDVKRIMSNTTTVRRVLAFVGRYYGVSIEDLASHRRTKDIIRPRQIAMYLARTLTKCSWTDLGRRLGGKDHSTVIHGAQTIEQMRQEDEHLDAELRELTTLIRGE